MFRPPRQIIDIRGRLWESEDWELELIDTPYLFKPRAPIVKGYTLTINDQLYDIQEEVLIELNDPETSEPFKIQTISSFVFRNGYLFMVTDDHRGLIYNCLDQKIEEIIEDVVHFIDVTNFISVRIVTAVIRPDRSIEIIIDHQNNGSREIIKLDERIEGEIIAIFNKQVITNNGRYLFDIYDNAIDFYDLHQGILAACLIENGNQEGGDCTIILNNDGYVSLLNQSEIKPTDLFCDELDDGSSWKEFIPLYYEDYIGIVNQSGKAYIIDKELCLGKVDIPREIFIKPNRTKNARNLTGE